jgi:hypothetical protein
MAGESGEAVEGGRRRVEREKWTCRPWTTPPPPIRPLAAMAPGQRRPVGSGACACYRDPLGTRSQQLALVVSGSDGVALRGGLIRQRGPPQMADDFGVGLEHRDLVVVDARLIAVLPG